MKCKPSPTKGLWFAIWYQWLVVVHVLAFLQACSYRPNQTEMVYNGCGLDGTRAIAHLNQEVVRMKCDDGRWVWVEREIP